MRIFSLSILIILPLLLGGCLQSKNQATPTATSGTITKSTTSFEQGREEGGGGEVLLSSKTVVRKEIERAWKYALHPSYRTNPLHQFAEFRWLTTRKNAADPIIDRIFDPSNALKKYSFVQREKIERRAGYIYFWEYLSQSAIEIRETEACSGGGKTHTDASVSHNRIGATICFSIPSLQKLPPHALLSEILSLIAHELVHINGLGEQEADAVHALASYYFSYMVGEVVTDNLRRDFGENLRESMDRISDSIEASKAPDQPKFLDFIIRAKRNLNETYAAISLDDFRNFMNIGSLKVPQSDQDKFIAFELYYDATAPICRTMYYSLIKQIERLDVLISPVEVPTPPLDENFDPFNIKAEEGPPRDLTPIALIPERLEQTYLELRSIERELVNIDQMQKSCFTQKTPGDN